MIGGGTNLIVADAGFNGIVLRFVGSAIEQTGLALVADAGAVLQSVVDKSVALGLSGMQTMTGIPGYLGGAVYGNAGAYGQSIHERVVNVVATNGISIKTFSNADSHFQYRDSWFKSHKEWVILQSTLLFSEGRSGRDGKGVARDSGDPRQEISAHHEMRWQYFQESILCPTAAHVQAQVPQKQVREGKVPSAWFLEKAGVMGMRRGDIQVATYHANLIYNDGAGTASDLVAVVRECKKRVADRFGFELEEEVQYVGF